MEYVSLLWTLRKLPVYQKLPDWLNQQILDQSLCRIRPPHYSRHGWNNNHRLSRHGWICLV